MRKCAQSIMERCGEIHLTLIWRLVDPTYGHSSENYSNNCFIANDKKKENQPRFAQFVVLQWQLSFAEAVSRLHFVVESINSSIGLSTNQTANASRKSER